MRARTWITVAGVCVVTLGLLGWAGTQAWRADRDRQPHVDADLVTMDQAVVQAVHAAGADPAVAIAGIVRSAACQVGILRHPGGRYTRAADLYTDPGHETTLMTRIANTMPNAWAAQLTQAPGSPYPSVQAYPATGVELSVQRLGEGWLTVRAKTACVIGGETPRRSDADRVTPVIEAVLQALGTTIASTHRETLACAGDGLATTIAITAPTNSRDLAQRLRPLVPAGARTFTSSSNRLAYRDAQTSLIAAASDDGTAATIRSTSTC
jgi:hypothetical protein